MRWAKHHANCGVKQTSFCREVKFGIWFSNTISAEGCLHYYCQKRSCASLTSPSTYIGSKITKVGLTLEFDPLFANDQQKSFIPSEQLLGCAVWLVGEELPLFSYNSDSSPLSLILVIIIFSRMMIMVMHIG